MVSATGIIETLCQSMKPPCGPFAGLVPAFIEKRCFLPWAEGVWPFADIWHQGFFEKSLAFWATDVNSVSKPWVASPAEAPHLCNCGALTALRMGGQMPNVNPGLINPWLINMGVSSFSGDSSLLEGTPPQKKWDGFINPGQLLQPLRALQVFILRPTLGSPLESLCLSNTWLWVKTNGTILG